MISNERKHGAQLVWTACVAVAVAIAGLHQSLRSHPEPAAFSNVAEAPDPDGAPRLEATELPARRGTAARPIARKPAAFTRAAAAEPSMPEEATALLPRPQPAPLAAQPPSRAAHPRSQSWTGRF